MFILTELMARKFQHFLEEYETLKVATWGGVPNIKGEAVLQKRKETLLEALDMHVVYVQSVQEELKTLTLRYPYRDE